MLSKKPESTQLWSPLVNFARCCGIIPMRPCEREPFFELCPGSLCLNVFQIILFLFTLIVSSVVLREVLNGSFIRGIVVAEACSGILYYLQLEVTLLFFLWHSRDRLSALLQQWIDTERALERIRHRSGSNESIYLGSLTALICNIIFSATVILSTLENTIYLVSHARYENEIKNVNHWFDKLASGDSKTDQYFGENRYAFGILLVIAETLGETVWVYGDYCIAFLSILLHRYYEIAVHNRLEEMSHSGNGGTIYQVEEIRQIYHHISRLAHSASDVFSLLIFFTIFFNISSLLCSLYSGLQEEMTSPHLLVRMNVSYGLVYLVLRILFSTILASRLADVPEKTVGYLHSLPSLLTEGSPHEQRQRLIQIEVFILQIQSDPVGLGGSGFFILSKSSTSTLFSLIVTHEIIMLQLTQ